MTSAVGNVTINGGQLLGGTAGKIDTDSLIEQLMKAKSIPQNQLKDRLDDQQNLLENLQEMNRRMQSVTSAAMGITDLTFDGVPSSATSSLDSVVASAASGATPGSATFHIEQAAAAQVSTVKANTSGDLVDDYTNGIDIGGHHIDLQSGSAKDIATAVNKAGIGVRATVVNTDDGQVLQLTASKTGEAGGFTVAGFTQSANDIVAAQDAKISVGTGAGAYTISSATNTFTDAMPGVTFSVSSAAVGQDVTLTVGDNVDALTDKMQDLFDALSSAKDGVKTLTKKGGLMQGDSIMNSIGFEISNVISSGAANGKSFSEYGIDLDKDGVISFDAAKFASAYNTDPEGTLDTIIDSFARPMRDISEAASTPVTGSLSQAINSDESKIDSLNTQIDKWDDRLDKEHDRLVAKYTAMQTALAQLQSQGDWLTSMFDSINGKDD